MSQTLIKWKLSEVMARHRIKGADLAERLQMTPNGLSRLKNARTMPKIDGNKLNAICNALNGLVEDTAENPKARITPAMLLEYVRDEETQPPSALPKLKKQRKAKVEKISKEEW